MTPAEASLKGVDRPPAIKERATWADRQAGTVAAPTPVGGGGRGVPVNDPLTEHTQIINHQNHRAGAVPTRQRSRSSAT